MNVIVSNRQKEIIDNANIDAIKDLNGLFSVDDLVNKFKNYFFSKMILDATSVVDFATKDVLQKLVDEIGSDRLIILLPSKPEPPEEFRKLLVDLKIYNFSNNIEDIVKYLEKPNTYENAMNDIMNSYGKNSEFYYDSSIKEGEDKDSGENNESNVVNNGPMNVDNNMNNNITNNNGNINNGGNNNTLNNISHTSLGDIMSKFNVHYDENVNNTNVNNEQPAQNNIAFQNVPLSNDNREEENKISAPTGNIFLHMDDFSNNSGSNVEKVRKVIGFRNITDHAGSTTLIYMLQKVADNNAISIEINKNDFCLFRSGKMISVRESDILNTLNSLRENIVFVDLNDCQDDSFCTDIVCLVEPSMIKLNRLMAMDKGIFGKLRDKKVILNQSMLSNTDIPILENEAGIKFFDVLGSLNERSRSKEIEELCQKLMLD